MAATLARNSKNRGMKQRVIHNPDCQICGICKKVKHVCVPGDGSESARVMIVGEAPGRYEDKHQMPFVGQIGQFLREKLLPVAGIDDDGDDVFMSNAARCWPKNNQNKSRTPSAAELRNCRQYLEAEIEWLKPKVIVPMGNAPMASILNMIYKPVIDAEGKSSKEGKVSGITRWRGKQIWHREFGCWVIPTFHPSYVSRQYGNDGSKFAFNQVVKDLEQAMYLAGKPLPKYKMPRRVLITDVIRGVAVLNKMWKAGTFAFDIETGGKGITIDKRIIGCSFACDAEVGYYIPWKVFIKHKHLLDGLLRLLRSEKHVKIMHNGAYEVRIFNFLGMSIYDQYIDTMILAHMVDENFGKSLKDLAWLHTTFGGYDVELDKYKSEYRIKEDYSLIPLEMLAPYGALDAVATFILYMKLKPILLEEKSYPTFDKIIMPVRRVMSEAEYNGIRVNKTYAENLSEVCDTAFDLIEHKIYESAGKEFNINSNQQLSKILYDELGYKPLRKTKTGYSVDEESIAYVEEQGGEFTNLLSDRAYIKVMNGTHISQAIRFCWGDGRVHTSYNMTGTVTGRASCFQPSLHNTPRDRLLRTMYIASPGCMLIDDDLRSAEFVYLAAESGEEAFIHAFAEGLDFHMEIARLIYKKKNPTKEERVFAKVTNFAIIYGMSAVGLAKRLKISVEEAEDFIRDYFARFPKIAAYLERCKEHARKYGYVQSLFRYRRRLPMAMSDIDYEIARAERQAMNSPIQNGAALYTYIGLYRLWKSLNRYNMKAKIVHTVHDCALTDTPKPEIEAVRELAVKAFTRPIKVIPVRMQIDDEVSKAWGENNESRLYDILESLGLENKLAA